MNSRLLRFTPLRQYPRGIIASLLRRSYAPLLAADPDVWGRESEGWEEFDREAFENLNTVGKCVFVSCLDEEVVGFGSFDPRKAPEVGVVGHNCILPEFQGRGYGTLQLIEILRRLKERGIDKAVVSTGLHPFFLPARRTYLACGFSETKRITQELDGRYGIVEYELDLGSFDGRGKGVRNLFDDPFCGTL